MSMITIPDSHPGRCKNYRTEQDRYGNLRSGRCIDYEGTEHVCEFDMPKPYVRAQTNYVTYTAPKPEPWVRPEKVGAP